jgi:DNA-directed RNA polymerase omega subunit
MNKPIGLSRGDMIDTEECVENIGSRYDLVLVAAQRAKDIKRRNRDSHKREHVHSSITALLEVQSGQIGIEYLKRIE